MDKLLGILPYIYLFDEPVRFGDVTFIGVPDWQDRNHALLAGSDRESLQELSACFPTTRGLSTDKGAVKAITYFLLDNKKGAEEETFKVARKAIALLRYALLRPDYQALDSIESTYLYAFNLPSAGGSEYRLYQCWPNLNLNQEIWISPEHEKFPLPGWYVDFQLVHTSQVEDMEQIEQCFYTQRMSEQVEGEILLAMDWYNQSFQKYSIRNIAGHLVDISIAFETLFQLYKNKITLKDAIRETFDVMEGSPLVDWAGDFYGRVRSAIEHFGKPASLLFKHSEAQTPHLSFLWSAQKIFRECVSVKAGPPRHIPNDRLIEELTPNEVHLNNLKKAGSFKNILEGDLLREVEKLRQIYPPGRRENIIWLGKELLRAYKEQFMTEEQSLPTLDLILDAEDRSPQLVLKYHQFLKEFRSIYPNGYIATSWGEVSEEATRKLKPITRDNIKQLELERTIYNFARFAG